MEKLKMHTDNLVDNNVKKIGALFPNALTEVQTPEGIKYAIDFDILRQELSKDLVEGNKERYRFEWPGKRQAILNGNAPISATLRPCRNESVDFDNTENLYIEGDNLDVLKLLQETYLGKITMIYIDPPYNTGNDSFVYDDDFSIEADEFAETSGQRDGDGNLLFDLKQNSESNGRFHTDWLNMMYPRLKLARDLLKDDGVIFISIDDKEINNILRVCDEIFNSINFVAIIPWRKRTAKSDVPFGVSQDYEWIVCYAKSNKFLAGVKGEERQYFETTDYPGKPWRYHDLTKQTTASERPNSYFTLINPRDGSKFPANPNRTWIVTTDTFEQYYKQGKIIFPGDYDFLNITRPVMRYWKEEDQAKAGERFGLIAVSTRLPEEIGMTQDGTKEITSLFGSKVFPFPKPSLLIKFLISISTDRNDIILDFFSGSATSAHAVMQLDVEDNKNRKYIMVQLPEMCDEASEAYKAGYKNICEIGKERIRRTANKIKEENQDANFDAGFRVLKLDSSNMKDVFYKPSELRQDQMSVFTGNIRDDRSSEDLLFQVMLELGALLSSKIVTTTINHKTVYNVGEKFLLACFDSQIDEEIVKTIALKKPVYAIFRDSGFANDNVAANYEQIFKTYSPDTKVKVL